MWKERVVKDYYVRRAKTMTNKVFYLSRYNNELLCTLVIRVQSQ